MDGLGQVCALQVGETPLALVLSGARELPQPPTSSVSWPVQPQHPAARSSERAASGGEETLPAIRHQVMIRHDLASWNRGKKEKRKVTKSNLVVALGGRVFQAFIFLQGLAWHGAVVPDTMPSPS